MNVERNTEKMKTETEQAQENIDLDDLVNTFAKAMRRRLQLCSENGYEGWNDPSQNTNLRRRLNETVTKMLPGGTAGTIGRTILNREYAAKLAVDAGNYAAMLYYQATHEFTTLEAQAVPEYQFGFDAGEEPGEQGE